MPNLSRNIILFLLGVVGSEVFQFGMLQLMRIFPRAGVLLLADVAVMGALIYFLYKKYPSFEYMAWGIGVGAVIFAAGVFLLI
jgi:hypothetical protein